MKRISGKNKKLAKFMSAFLGCATLFVPMNVLGGCSFWDDDDDNNDKEVVDDGIKTSDGIVNWSDFEGRAMTTSVDDTTGALVYSFDKDISNKDEIKGFSGYVNYEKVKAFVSSTLYNNVRYNTKNLSIYFNYVPRDGEGVEITPSLLETIYAVFDSVNISDVNANGDRTPVKFSSGDETSPEIFDLEKFYARLKNAKLSVPSDAIITQSTTSANLVGVEDPYLRDERVSDSEKLLYLLSSPLFANSKVDVVNLNGNVKKVLDLFGREAVDGNIKFATDAFYASDNENVVDDISIETVQNMVLRGAMANVSGANIYGRGVSLSTNMTFDGANLQNVSFKDDLDLSGVSFNNVTSKKSLSFEGVLPSSMKYLNAENVVFDGMATVPDVGTNITGANIGNLEIKSLSNVAGFEKDADASNGIIKKFKGSNSNYKVLKEIFNISGGNVELITKLMLNSQNIYS